MEILMKNKKLITVGESVGFTVDAAYIRNGQLKLGQYYNIVVKEVSSNASE